MKVPEGEHLSHVGTMPYSKRRMKKMDLFMLFLQIILDRPQGDGCLSQTLIKLNNILVTLNILTVIVQILVQVGYFITVSPVL